MGNRSQCSNFDITEKPMIKANHQNSESLRIRQMSSQRSGRHCCSQNDHWLGVCLYGSDTYSPVLLDRLSTSDMINYTILNDIMTHSTLNNY